MDGFDTTRRFIRVTHRRKDGFVAFDFAMGDASVFLEMLLPETDFDAFRTTQNARPFPEPSGETEQGSDWDWRLADATGTRFRSHPQSEETQHAD